MQEQREERQRDRYATLLTLRGHYYRARFARVAMETQGWRLKR